MAENQVYLIKSGQNSFVEETQAIVGISGGKLGIGTTHPEADFHVTGDAKIGGNLTVDGTLTTINSSTVSVDDKNIELGVTDNPTDTTAHDGGITLKGTTDKTFNWNFSTDAWTSSEHLYLATGKHFSADEMRALDSDGLKLADQTTSGILIKGGKVGIHQATPVYDLDVDGSGNFASLYVGGNSVLTGDGSIFGKWEDGSTTGEIFYTGGNVGVGTDDPASKLHVDGDARVDGNFTINGTSGNFNVDQFNVSGEYININRYNDALNNNRGGLSVHDPRGTGELEYLADVDYWQLNKKISVLGDVNVQNNLTIGGLISNDASVQNNFTVGNDLTVSGNFEVKGTTTTVNTQTVTIEDHNLVIASNTGYNQLTAEYPSEGGGYAGLFWGTGDNGGASPVSLTYQHNKGFNFTGAGVGIGVDHPAYDLDVAGTGNFSSVIQNGNTVVDQGDVGSAPNQIPLNKDLGTLAYMDAPEIEDLNVDTLELREIAAEMSETAVDVFVYDTRKDSDGGAWRERTSHTSWYNEELNTTTRGGRREFPAVAVIVAEASKVTIYDGDDPDLSMWMVFNRNNSFIYDQPSSVTALNGKIVLGGYRSGSTQYSRVSINDFVADVNESINSTLLYKFSGIVNRNIANYSSYYTSSDVNYLILSGNSNDVAMTVLPNALIDTETGLPIPTIAVATDGGVSVIKDDGSVVDIVSDNLNAETPLEVNFRGRLLYMLLGSAEGVSNSWNSVSTIYIPDNDVSTTYRNAGDYVAQYFRYNGLPATEPDNSGHDMLVPINSQTHLPLPQRSRAINVLGTDHLYIGGEGYEDKAGGVATISENLTNPKNGLLAYTTSSYNTGWMPGDIKLATLSDTKNETVGVDETTELLVDGSGNWIGDFNVATDVNEWTGAGGTIDGDLGYVKITQTSGATAYLTIPINTIVGKNYKISADIRTSVTDTVDTGAAFYIGETAYQNDVALRRPMVSEDDFSNFSLDFVATTSVTHITLACWAADGDSADFKNVSLTQTGELITNGTFDADSDWTKGTGWTINGGVTTKTGSDNTSILQDIDTIAGKNYVVSLDIVSGTGNSGAKLYVDGVLVLDNLKDAQSISVDFVATDDSTTIAINGGSFDGGSIDNISVRLAEEDRSVNNSGLQIFGQIDKTPVAPGADLVAYSGFSVDNYLMQPYNSDLDFGTGDFCVMGWFNTQQTSGNAYDDLLSVGDLGVAGYSAWSEGGLLIQNRTDNNRFLSYLSTPSDQANITLPQPYYAPNVWNHFVIKRESGLVNVFLNGVQEGNPVEYNYNFARNNNPNWRFLIGYSGDNYVYPANSSKLTLFRISATAPTAEQITKIYRDEKPLFQDGAQATLYGTSDAVTALAYDDSDDLLHVGTASGRSSFNGLKRVDNTTTAVTTAISATEGLVIEQ